MKDFNYSRQNATPIYVEERDVLGQIKPHGNSLTNYRHRIKNAPDLKVTYAGLG